LNKVLFAICALVLSSAVHSKQLLENSGMVVNTDGWKIWSGDTLSHDSSDGDFTPFGSARVTGNVDGVAAIAASCIDVSHWAYLAPFKAEASIKPYRYASNATTVGISIQNYSDVGCQYETDIVTETRAAVPGEWTFINGDFSLLEGTKGIRVVLFATETPNGGNVNFDDASLAIGRETLEIFDNPDLSENTTGWWLYWGHTVEYNSREGHLTPSGSIRTEGQAVVVGARGPYTGIRSVCVDIADRAPLDQFRVAASAKPDGDATNPEMGINADFYSDSGCRSHFSTLYFLGDSKVGAWSRLEGTFVPPEGAKGLIVKVRSNGVSDKGGALFDDISLTLTQAVRQLWLIGVGEITDQKIKPFNMQYTRGGDFAGQFDPKTIAQETFVSLEIEFDDCNSGEITYIAESTRGSYPIMRLAQNESVLACEERGFNNMGDDNGWMAGYWFGAPDHEGEGFVIDVLSGSQQAVVTWYTYMPSWGADAPR
jgi:hypothetical protein